MSKTMLFELINPEPKIPFYRFVGIPTPEIAEKLRKLDGKNLNQDLDDKDIDWFWHLIKNEKEDIIPIVERELNLFIYKSGSVDEIITFFLE